MFLGLVLSGALAVVLVPYAVLNMGEGLAALSMLLQSGPLTGVPADTPLAVQAALPLLGLATSVTVGRYFTRYRALRRGIGDFIARRFLTVLCRWRGRGTAAIVVGQPCGAAIFRPRADRA